MHASCGVNPEQAYQSHTGIPHSRTTATKVAFKHIPMSFVTRKLKTNSRLHRMVWISMHGAIGTPTATTSSQANNTTYFTTRNQFIYFRNQGKGWHLRSGKVENLLLSYGLVPMTCMNDVMGLLACHCEGCGFD